MRAYDIKIECEEDGFHIVIDGDSIDPEYQAGMYGWKIEDPEQLYDRVNAAIGPWLQEREEAFAEFRQAVKSGTGPAAAYFACNPDESGGRLTDAGYENPRAYDQPGSAYNISDPKHPDFHSVHADIWDSREGK